MHLDLLEINGLVPIASPISTVSPDNTPLFMGTSNDTERYVISTQNLHGEEHKSKLLEDCATNTRSITHHQLSHIRFGDDPSTLHQGQRGGQLPKKRTLWSAPLHGFQNFNNQKTTHTEQNDTARSKTGQNTESEKHRLQTLLPNVVRIRTERPHGPKYPHNPHVQPLRRFGSPVSACLL